MNLRLSCLLLSFTLMFAIAIPQPVQSAEPEAIKNSIDMKLALIPAGSFKMGSPREEAQRDDKEELHEVEITKPFYIGVYEVKQSEYTAVMEESTKERNRSSFRDDNSPAENVEWKLAKLFCSELSARPEEKKAGRKYRLPTEAEWEYACRAGTSAAFHVGDSLSASQANFNGNFPAGNGEKGEYLRSTTKVGSYEPNAFGLYDMHGNVAEWCSDWYDPNYYRDSPNANPHGPSSGVVSTKFTNYDDKNFFVVVRGGSWLDDGRACRSAYRFRAMPNTRYRLIGFRVVCEVANE